MSELACQDCEKIAQVAAGHLTVHELTPEAVALHKVDHGEPCTFKNCALAPSLAAIEHAAVTTFLQSERAESLLAEALRQSGYDSPWTDNWWEDADRMAADTLKAILASLLEEMKR